MDDILGIITRSNSLSTEIYIRLLHPNGTLDETELKVSYDKSAQFKIKLNQSMRGDKIFIPRNFISERIKNIVKINNPPYVRICDQLSIIEEIFCENVYGNLKKDDVKNIFQKFIHCREKLKTMDMYSCDWRNNKDNKEIKDFLKICNKHEFLSLWYSYRIIRKFILMGISMKDTIELRRFRFSDVSLIELYDQFIETPYLFFTLDPDKMKNIAIWLDKQSQEKERTYMLLHSIYDDFKNGKNGYPIGNIDSNLVDKISDIIVKYNGYIYFKYIFAIEKSICKRLEEISHSIVDNYDVDDIFVDYKGEPRRLNSEQYNAVKGCLRSSIGIITGGAGTGKTTIIQKIIESLECNGEKVRISAFTGKAVNVLRKKLKRDDPQTLSLMLEKEKRKTEEEYDKFDVLIIDEASMVSSNLLNRIFQTFNHPFKLYLIGDINQLPPVLDWGRPFYDLIKNGNIQTFRLSESHRNGGSILTNAKGIAESDDWNLSYDNESFINQGCCNIVEFIRKLLSNKSNTITSDTLTVLSPYNKILKENNEEISKLFLPRAQQMKDLNGTWRLGDRVVNTKNRYDLERPIMNGQEGKICAMTDDGVFVKFDDDTDKSFTQFFEFKNEKTNKKENDKSKNKIKVDESDNQNPKDEKDIPTTDQLEQSYVMTIHKSQGSEWENVILFIPYPSLHDFISKNLLYTAITRAKKKLWIITMNDNIIKNGLRTPTDFGNDALKYLYKSGKKFINI